MKSSTIAFIYHKAEKWCLRYSKRGKRAYETQYEGRVPFNFFSWRIQYKMPRAGNTEEGKCQLTNDYLFFLFLIGRWYYEKNILFL